jgi:hypothetical protein
VLESDRLRTILFMFVCSVHSLCFNTSMLLLSLCVLILILVSLVVHLGFWWDHRGDIILSFNVRLFLKSFEQFNRFL